MNHWTRREFIRASLVGGGAACLAQSRLYGAIGPTGSANEDVRLAIVGLNGKGNSHIHDFRQVAGCRIVALCDVDREILARRVAELAQDNIPVTSYGDYRRLLEDPGIDAVVLATPNHWHSLQTIWACQAGKDVYVEKPLSHNIWEGRQAVAAAEKYQRIVQAGTQSRSALELHQAAAYLREGNLGRIQWARGLCYKERRSIGRTAGPQPVPASIDYDLWCGPAPLTPPRRDTPEHGPVHYDWHWFWAYGGGDIANQGVHQMDVCRWLIGATGLPRTVMSLGGRFGYEDDAETPNTLISLLNYAPAPIIFEVRGLPAKAGLRMMDRYRTVRGIAAVIQCEGGYFAPGETGGGVVYDNQHKRITQFTGEGGSTHAANFIAAMKSRRQTDLAGRIEELQVSSSLCHLANISYRLGTRMLNAVIRERIARDPLAGEACERMLAHLAANEIDPGRAPSTIGPLLTLAPGLERFESAEKYDPGYWANTMLTREYRKPFVVPENV